MRAVIDLGTNTFHLLIAEIGAGRMRVLSRLQIPVKIGEGGINGGVISEAAFERGMHAIGRFREELNKYGILDVLAFGTSAIRDARNGAQFIAEARDRYRIVIEAISGEDEAEYIYEGVKQSFPFPESRVLVMDIGGGSVEFIIGEQEQILWKQSFKVGAARLLDKFHQEDPITPEACKALQGYLNESLTPLRLALKEWAPGVLVGSAGAFETLHEVLEKDLGCEIARIGEYACEVKIPDAARFCRLMVRSDAPSRAALHGMVDFRVDMIVVSALLMQWVMEQMNPEAVIVSCFSLKEGMLYRSA